MTHKWKLIKSLLIKIRLNIAEAFDAFTTVFRSKILKKCHFPDPILQLLHHYYKLN